MDKDDGACRIILDQSVTSQMAVSFGPGGIPRIGLQPAAFAALRIAPWTAVSTENLGDAAYVILHAPLIGVVPGRSDGDPVGLSLWLPVSPPGIQSLIDHGLTAAGSIELVPIIVDAVGVVEIDNMSPVPITRATS